MWTVVFTNIHINTHIHTTRANVLIDGDMIIIKTHIHTQSHLVREVINSRPEIGRVPKILST